MPSEMEAPKLDFRETEQRATERAGERVKAAKWDYTMAILAYAILGAVVLLRLQGVAIEIVAAVAILGLAGVWLLGWRQRRQLFKRFYIEELRQLKEFTGGEKVEVSVPSPLTPRETEIISHIAHGYANKEIANMLQISEQTIKNHMSSILGKLEANDRTQAVVMAMHYGWVSSRPREPSESVTNDKIKSK